MNVKKPRSPTKCKGSSSHYFRRREMGKGHTQIICMCSCISAHNSHLGNIISPNVKDKAGEDERWKRRREVHRKVEYVWKPTPKWEYKKLREDGMCWWLFRRARSVGKENTIQTKTKKCGEGDTWRCWMHNGGTINSLNTLKVPASVLTLEIARGIKRVGVCERNV